MSEARYTVTPVGSADEAAFEEVWGALRDEFGPRGEIERREVVARWLANPGGYGAAGLRVTYHLLGVRDAEGRLAAARDHHVVVDRERALVTVYLAHALVLPEHRRRGLARELRAVASAQGEAIAERAGLAKPEILLAAEMEPFDPASPDTATRLVAYGKDGFAAIEPARILYQQPDFGDLGKSGEPARPIPLLAVLRRVGHEGEPALPREVAEAYVRHLHAVFATHCRASDLAPLAARSHGALATAGPRVPLVPLPTTTADAVLLEPLHRARVLPLYALN